MKFARFLAVLEDRQGKPKADARREDRENAGVRVVQGLALAVDVLESVDDIVDSQRFAGNARQVFLRVLRGGIDGTGPDTITYEATLEDPKTYSRPWKIRMPLHRNTEAGFELRDQECTEGDDGRPIHPPYRPAPHGDVFEFVREYPGGKAGSK